MNTQIKSRSHQVIGTLAAITIVSFNVLALDQAHLASAPRGIVEIGELVAVNEPTATAAVLPEVTVTARRELHSATRLVGFLPEVVVVAERIASQLATTSRGVDRNRTVVRLPAAGALLK